MVEVELWPDEAPREPALPADLARALDALPGGLEAFESLTEAQREGMVAFLERARYVGRVVGEVQAAAGVTGRLLQQVKQLPCGEELRTCTWRGAKDASFH